MPWGRSPPLGQTVSQFPTPPTQHNQPPVQQEGNITVPISNLCLLCKAAEMTYFYEEKNK